MSPVDGKVLEYAPIEEGTLIQAKGLDYRLEDLVPTKDADLLEWSVYDYLFSAQ